MDLFFAVAALVLAPITLTDLFLNSAGGKVSGGPLYAWTFLPLGTRCILFAYWVLIGHVRSSVPGSRKFPILHLIGFVFASAGGFKDMLAVVEPGLHVFSSCKSLGVLIFGGSCAPNPCI